jgi:hypothetical protein
MGLAGRSGLAAGLERVGSAQKDILFSSRKYFSMQRNPEKSRKCFRGTKNIQKIPKILGKFPEID